jgi:23S rRNA (guanosine2251-2'-O)-methyltransferase
MKGNFSRQNIRRGRGGGRDVRRGEPRREKIYSYGKHALEEALRYAPRSVRKVLLSSELSHDEELRALLKSRGIAPEILKNHEADRIVGEETAHQGAIAIIDPAALIVSFDDFMREQDEKLPDEKTMLVLLDELTDPHNVGAIIRSAVAFGASGVLLPSHNQAGITGAVVKASAGMVFRVPIVAIGNVNQTVDTLKKIGFRTYGLAMNGSRELGEETFDAPVLVIVGNEGKGIREKTLERCDVVVRIPMDSRAESLNASVSAAIVLYAWSMRHLNR